MIDIVAIITKSAKPHDDGFARMFVRSNLFTDYASRLLFMNPSSLLITFFVSLMLLAWGSLPVSASAYPNVTISVGNTIEIVPNERISEWFRIITSNVFDFSYQSEIEDRSFCPLPYGFCNFSMSRKNRDHVRTKVSVVLDEGSVRDYLRELAQRTDTDPQDAVFGTDKNDKIIPEIPGVFGQSLDQEKSLDIFREKLVTLNGESLSLELPIRALAPEIRMEDLDRLGISELIGSGSSNFRGSPKNRIYNIKRSLEQFQSLIIAPGEEFSFVEHLGEVDEVNGYLPELVIRNNKTEPEFGGGVCQVSSTVFRAAIYSGMKITERRNHSYPVQYYLPYGMDATIYIPKPDFKFLNNTGNAVMMQSVIEGTKLTFRFFGTKDGRDVSIDGPYILERNTDGSMKTTFTQVVKSASGQEIIRDEFKSNYKSPSLFPHPGEEQQLMAKPADWSNRQWREYKKLNP